MINFATIPASIRTAGQYIEFDSSRAVQGLPAVSNRVLLFGLKLAAGSAAPLTIQPIYDPGQGVTLFGRGSMLARMIAAYRKADPWSEIHAIAMNEDAAGTAASGTITVNTAATAAGVIPLMVAGVPVPVTVAAGDSAAAIAGKIEAAIDAMLDLPVTASLAGAVVTLTARHKGTSGNEVDIRHSHNPGEALPAGVTLTIVAMASGATDPDIDSVWPVIGDNPYRALVLGITTAAVLGKAKTELDSRWGAARMLETIGYGAKSGTQGTLAAFGAALNSELLTVLGTGKSPTWPSEAAAIHAAVCSYHSAIDPARPLQSLELVGLVAPKAEDRFTRPQRELLLKDGISTFVPDQSGVCRIERAITTYQTDAFGLDNVAFLDLESPSTLAYLRASLRARIAAKFPRHKVADDGTRFGSGQQIVTPSVIRAELIALAREWEEAGLVENLDQFIADLIVERDASDPNRINALVPPNLVNQFRVFAAAVQFRL